jgi:hypothetical protein
MELKKTVVTLIGTEGSCFLWTRYSINIMSCVLTNFIQKPNAVWGQNILHVAFLWFTLRIICSLIIAEYLKNKQRMIHMQKDSDLRTNNNAAETNELFVGEINDCLCTAFLCQRNTIIWYGVPSAEIRGTLFFVHQSRLPLAVCCCCSRCEKLTSLVSPWGFIRILLLGYEIFFMPL